jgi:Tol biopolymer transport system component
MQGAHANAFITYSSPAWSSDGRLLVFKKARNAGSSGQEYLESMQVYDLNSQESKEILAGEWVSGFAWQPGTHLLAYSLMVNPNYFESDGNVNAKLAGGILGIDVDSAEITELVQPQRYSLVSPQWSPDGRFLSFNEVLYMEGSGNFAYYDFQDESYTRWVRPIGNYSWSHDGESLVYDYQIYIPDGMESIQLNDRFDEGETLLWEPEDGLFSVNPLFSPDDEQIVFKEGEPFQDVTLIDLLILDLESGESESILEQAEVYDIQWSPDGEFILALIGPYDNPTLLEINAYDYTSRVLAHGWWPAWQPLSE